MICPLVIQDAVTLIEDAKRPAGKLVVALSRECTVQSLGPFARIVIA